MPDSVRVSRFPHSASARRGLLKAAAAGLAAGMLPAAQAQAYPSRPIRWLIPFSAGGPTDVLARAIAPKLSAVSASPSS